MAERLQLTACKTCRSRKRPCDKASPRCALCVKADLPCVFTDTASGEEYTRQQIADLEKQESELRAELSHIQAAHPPAAPESTVRPAQDASPAEGSNVLETILSNPRFHPQRLRQILIRPQIQQPEVDPAERPDWGVAQLVFANYFKESHVQRPMLREHDVQALLQRAYSEGRVEQLGPQDSYMFYMICAISAVRLRRQGLITQHPYSFFLSALQHVKHINLLSGVVAIQNLLLLGRFSIYFRTGVSIWDIGRICVHLCIELEFHLKPLIRLAPAEEQHRRILFWESYITDRHNSTILGRPFAIADEDIEVELPVALSEMELHNLVALPAAGTGGLSDSPMAVFLAFTRLRQISSKIHGAFFAKPRVASSQLGLHARMTALGELLDTFQILSAEIRLWRQNSPIYGQTETFYQMQEWYEFLAEKEQMFLTRGAIDAIHLQTGSRPAELCTLCCHSSSRLIHLYSGLYWSKQINCTRHYFQIMFTAGLLLAYFSTDAFQDFNGSQYAQENQGYLTTLVKCYQVLQGLSKEMRDAAPYAEVFGSICEAVLPGWKTSDHQWQSMLEVGTGTSRHGFDGPATLPSNLHATIEGDFDLNGTCPFPNTWLNGLPDWTYSPGHLFADMEAYVGQFATGDFTWDPLNPMSWDDPMDDLT